MNGTMLKTDPALFNSAEFFDRARARLRFEIPPGRSLQNIDHLIASSHNEEEKKELKAQKRLLRNRQAA